MNVLIIEDSGFGYTWWIQNIVKGWHVVSTQGNTSILTTVNNISQQCYESIFVLLDYVEDNPQIFKIKKALVKRNIPNVHLLYYPCFEWALLTSDCGKEIITDVDIYTEYVANPTNFRKSSMLVQFMNNVYGSGNDKSSEKLAKQLLLKCVSVCAQINAKRVGIYWTQDCNCRYQYVPCKVSTLATKNASILKQTGVDFNV